jgi:hypothetical protein
LLTNSKIFFSRRTRASEASPQERVLETATAWLGYTGQGSKNEFLERAGYSGVTWAGAFIDCVFHDSNFLIPACVYPASGLGEFLRDGRVVKNPQPGDIVFFNFATGDNFGVMHIGLVADITRWQTDSLLGTIEAYVNSGLAKSDPSLRGVFRRVRSGHEILAIARPSFESLKKEVQPAPVIKYETVKPGRRNKDIGHVQDALVIVTGLRHHTPDMFDAQTQYAYARWQRMTGRVGDNASGLPDRASLQLLGERTRKFKLDA